MNRTPDGLFKRRPWLLPQDLMLTISMAGCRAIAAVVPERLWAKAVELLADSLAKLRRSGTGPALRKIEAFFPTGVPGYQSSSELLRAIKRSIMWQRFIYTRLLRHPHWRPELSVSGMDQIRAARDRGQGVVLWCAPQVLGPLLMRVGLNDLGVTVHWLRHENHGASESLFGTRIIGRKHWRVEDRVANHVTLIEGGGKTAMARMRALLAAGETVAIRGIGKGNRPLKFPALGGQVQLAVGAPRIALTEGATLFASTLSTEGEGAWRLTFTSLPIEGETTVEELAARYASILESSILESPELWSVIDPTFQER